LFLLVGGRVLFSSLNSTHAMLPSKKVFVGSSLVITAVSVQVILGFVANRMIGKISAGVETSAASDKWNGTLDEVHRQSMVLFAGFGLVWVLMVSGLFLFVIGVYQNCRATEELARRSGE